MDLRESVSATTPSEVVQFDKLTPTTSGVVFDPNTPATSDVLYVSTVNASTWIYNGSSYITYTAATLPNTPFYLLGTTIDAGGNKTAAIEHSGPLRATTFTGFGLGITGLNATNLAAGIVNVNRLGSSGTRDNTTYLRGDNTWATISAGGLTYFTEAQNSSAPNATVKVDSLTAVSGTTDADISIVPKGAGAFLLAVPDNTIAGGNKRGTGSVDLQMSRTANTQVASGIYSSILGGVNNISSGAYSVSIGRSNTSIGDYSVSFGQNNIASGNYSIAMGLSCTASGLSSVSLGQSNTASDYATSIGFSNATTSNSASVGHSNIHNGANYGYAFGRGNTVGVSATNSFTAGFNNLVSADRAVAIGGGVTASAQSSSAIGGQNNTASGTYSFVGGGSNNVASGSYSITMGFTNIASSLGDVAIGYQNTASGGVSVAIGRSANTFTKLGRQSFSSGFISTSGDCQLSLWVMKTTTTDATPTVVTTSIFSTTPGLSNQIILENNSCYRFKGQIVGKKTGTTDVGVWDIDGVIVRGANAASTTLTISNINLVTNASGWGTPTLTADTTNGGLKVTVIGLLSTSIGWNATLETIEVIY